MVNSVNSGEIMPVKHTATEGTKKNTRTRLTEQQFSQALETRTLKTGKQQRKKLLAKLQLQRKQLARLADRKRQQQLQTARQQGTDHADTAPTRGPAGPSPHPRSGHALTSTNASRPASGSVGGARGGRTPTRDDAFRHAVAVPGYAGPVSRTTEAREAFDAARDLNADIAAAKIIPTDQKQRLLAQGIFIRPCIEMPEFGLYRYFNETPSGPERIDVLIKKESNGKITVKPPTAFEYTLGRMPHVEHMAIDAINRGYTIKPSDMPNQSMADNRQHTIEIDSFLVQLNPFMAVAVLSHEIEHTNDPIFDMYYLDFPKAHDFIDRIRLDEGRSRLMELAPLDLLDPESQLYKDFDDALTAFYGTETHQKSKALYQRFKAGELTPYAAYRAASSYYQDIDKRIKHEEAKWNEEWKRNFRKPPHPDAAFLSAKTPLETDTFDLPGAPERALLRHSPAHLRNEAVNRIAAHRETLTELFQVNLPTSSTRNGVRTGSTTYDVFDASKGKLKPYRANYRINAAGEITELRINKAARYRAGSILHRQTPTLDPRQDTAEAVGSRFRDFLARKGERQQQAAVVLERMHHGLYAQGPTPIPLPQLVAGLAPREQALLRDAGFQTPDKKLDSAYLSTVLRGDYAMFDAFIDNLQADSKTHLNRAWELRALEIIGGLPAEPAALDLGGLVADPACRAALLKGGFTRQDGSLDVARVRHARQNPGQYRNVIAGEQAATIIGTLRERLRRHPGQSLPRLLSREEQGTLLDTCGFRRGKKLDQARIRQLATDDRAWTQFREQAQAARAGLTAAVASRPTGSLPATPPQPSQTDAVARRQALANQQGEAVFGMEESLTPPDTTTPPARDLLAAADAPRDGIGLLHGRPVYRQGERTVALPHDVVLQLFDRHGTALLKAMSGMNGVMKDQTLAQDPAIRQRLDALLGEPDNWLLWDTPTMPRTRHFGVTDVLHQLRTGLIPTLAELNPAQRFVLTEFFPDGEGKLNEPVLQRFGDGGAETALAEHIIAELPEPVSEDRKQAVEQRVRQALRGTRALTAHVQRLDREVVNRLAQSPPPAALEVTLQRAARDGISTLLADTTHGPVLRMVLNIVRNQTTAQGL
ncbi:MAG: hypothetical protein WED00_13505 [Aquisalimonadaceae bacterium]